MGANKDGKQIVMGTPLAHNVSRREAKGADADSMDAYTWGRKKRRERLDLAVKMYLPYNFQDGKEEPPKPTSKHVRVDKFPAWTAHVAGFEGWPTRANFKRQTRKLTDYLEEDGKDYADEWGVFSVYNAPVELEDRWNEVLLSAEAGEHGGRGPVLL